MPTWLLNPKNLIMIALAALLIIVGGLFLWQKAAKVELEAERDKLKLENTAKTEIIDQLQTNITQIKLHQDRQQAIERATGILRVEVARIDEKLGLGGEYELQTVKKITDSFNNAPFGGVSSVTDDNSTTEVLPKTVKAGNDIPDNSPGVER
jgi:hypothetical protein